MNEEKENNNYEAVLHLLTMRKEFVRVNLGYFTRLYSYDNNKLTGYIFLHSAPNSKGIYAEWDEYGKIVSIPNIDSIGNYFGFSRDKKFTGFDIPLKKIIEETQTIKIIKNNGKRI